MATQPETSVLRITARQGDLNAAMMLLDTIPDDYTPRLVRILVPIYGKIERHWKCTIMPNTAGEEYGAIDVSPAVAIYNAYVAYAAHATGPGRKGAES